MTSTLSRSEQSAPSACPLPGRDRCPTCGSEWVGPVLVPSLDASRYHCWEIDCDSKGEPWEKIR